MTAKAADTNLRKYAEDEIRLAAQAVLVKGDVDFGDIPAEERLNVILGAAAHLIESGFVTFASPQRSPLNVPGINKYCSAIIQLVRGAETEGLDVFDLAFKVADNIDAVIIKSMKLTDKKIIDSRVAEDLGNEVALRLRTNLV